MPDKAQPDPTLGGRIKWRREALGLTQRQVADAMGVKSTESVRKWESDEQAPDLLRLGAVLDVRPAWLAVGEEPMLPAVVVDREQLDRIESLLGKIRNELSGRGQPDRGETGHRLAELEQEDRDDEDAQDDEAQPDQG